MACSCRTHKKTDGTNNIRSTKVALPHNILPGESCIFCAEKHIATAFSALISHGIRAITRQLMIGELECARRHTFMEYPDMAVTIAKAMESLVLRAPNEDAFKLIDDTRAMVSDLAEKTTNGEDVTTADPYQANTSYVTSINPLVGEIYMATAWRLAHECGYSKPNRSVIIGDIAMAQVHLFRFNYEIAERLRDIRHRIQRTEGQHITGDWNILAQNLDVAITPAINDIKETYGADLSGYLTV